MCVCLKINGPLNSCSILQNQTCLILDRLELGCLQFLKAQPFGILSTSRMGQLCSFQGTGNDIEIVALSIFPPTSVPPPFFLVPMFDQKTSFWISIWIATGIKRIQKALLVTYSNEDYEKVHPGFVSMNRSRWVWYSLEAADARSSTIAVNLNISAASWWLNQPNFPKKFRVKIKQIFETTTYSKGPPLSCK